MPGLDLQIEQQSIQTCPTLGITGGAIPAVLGQRCVYTLDKSLVHPITQEANNHPHHHTHICGRFAVGLMCRYLDSGRKMEHLDLIENSNL